MGEDKGVLVLGCSGMLGHDLMDILGRSYAVTGVDIDELDITDSEQTRRFINVRKPAAVINAAARTDVDGCESDPEGAFGVNGSGAEYVAAACAEAGAYLIQLSTDYVFDGLKGEPYHEDDRTNPRSVYGKSKLAGEDGVRKSLENYLIVRTSWLFGAYGKNFVATILKAAREKHLLEVVGDQYGCPTYTRDLADAIGALLEKECVGIVNVTNSGVCSWFEYAREILELAGVKGVKIRKISSERLERPAPRPPFSVLDGTRYTRLTGKRMRHWREAVKDYIELTGNRTSGREDDEAPR
jgi:dTDP-4-dehydrorhamnose reductase